jgi:outer membrane immunogenic protein
MKFIPGIGIAAATIMVAGQALAADVPRMPRKAAPLVPFYYNWTGFYVGFNVGYGTGTSTWDIPAVSLSPKGMTYGATVGYNWQAGSFVYGIEADYSVSDVKGSLANCGGLAGVTCETSNPWLATFRGRLGYAFDRFMPYVTAGGAYGDIKATISPAGLTANEAKMGYAAGVGLEYAFLGNWTAKVEYLYVNLGKFDTGFFTPVVDNVSFDESIVRVGVNYKFR